MLKAIIFDFFDVVRSDPYNAWLTYHGFVREGGYLKASEKLDGGLIDLTEFFELLGSLSNQDAAAIRQEFAAVAQIDWAVLELVNSLKRNYKIALLSNSPSEFIREILRENDLHTYFDEIVISSEVGHIKPSQEIFDITLQKLHVAPSEALFTDDNPRHIEGAEAAGIKSIRFESAAQLKAELQKLDILQ